MAKDPQRLKSMSNDLRQAAKGFGINVPGVPGTGKLPGIMRAIPGLPPDANRSQPENSPAGGEKLLRSLLGR